MVEVVVAFFVVGQGGLLFFGASLAKQAIAKQTRDDNLSYCY